METSWIAWYRRTCEVIFLMENGRRGIFKDTSLLMVPVPIVPSSGSGVLAF